MSGDGNSHPTRDEAIDAGLRAARLDESERATVAFFLDRPDEDWRTCCGDECVPCIDQVGRAVDVARRLLGLGPGEAK